MALKNAYLIDLMSRVEARNPNDKQFLITVRSVLESIEPVVEKHPEYVKAGVLELFVEQERVIKFRVPWVDDQGNVHVNRGYRVQGNSAIGPYKGGLRLHPSVTEDTVKFLAFEQTLKNSLTGLPIGGGKGGSDFDPKGKSDMEVMRFCQSFMSELFKYIGADIDVPAGDIGVGAREIGFLYGQYKRITNKYEGVLTGKGLSFGGSLVRTQATGYGNVYFALNMLASRSLGLEGKVCTVSGAGNVATYCVEKLQQLGAKPVTVSDSRGSIYDKDGIDVAVLKQVKEVEHASLTRYAELRPSAQYVAVKDYPEGRHFVWTVPCFAAFPCATQNEVNEADAKELIKNGCQCVSEGANMPSTLEAIQQYLNAGILYGPAKAANAGGVSVSQLEMAQNAHMVHWTFDEVDNRLKGIMHNIYTRASETAKEFGSPDNLLLGANISAFREVADAMILQGDY